MFYRYIVFLGWIVSTMSFIHTHLNHLVMTERKINETTDLFHKNWTRQLYYDEFTTFLHT